MHSYTLSVREKYYFKIGALIGIYPIKIILVGGILGFIIITTAFKNIKNRITKGDTFCDLKVIINSVKIEEKAIIDTGNFLRDPITKMPVIVIEKEALKEAIPDEILDNLSKIIEGKQNVPDEFISKIRLIPFSSLGKQNGLLLGIKPDETIIYYQDKTINLKNIIIGIYDGILTKAGKYRSLIGLDAVEMYDSN